MKTILSVFTALTLITFALVPPSFSQILHQSEPIMLNSSKDIIPVLRHDPTDFNMNWLSVGIGEEHLAVFYSCLQPESAGFLTIADEFGNLQDSVPVLETELQYIPPTNSEPHTYTFWVAPYFYLIGSWYESGVRHDSAAVIRYDENMQRIDEEPHLLPLQTPGRWSHIRAVGGKLYMYDSGRRWLYDLASDSAIIIDDTVFASTYAYSNASAIVSGGQLVAQKSRVSEIYELAFSDSTGGLRELGSIPLTEVSDNEWRTDLKLASFGSDSAVACMLRGGGDNFALEYCTIDLNGDVSMNELQTVDLTKPESLNDMVQFGLDADGTTVTLLTTILHSYSDSVSSLLIRFDPTSGVLIEQDSIPGEVMQDHTTPWSFLSTENRYVLHYIDSGGVYQLSLSKSDPTHDYQKRLLSFSTQWERHPTVATVDEDVVVAYGAVTREHNLGLRGYVVDPVTFAIHEMRDFIADGFESNAPTIRQFGDIKVLHWFERDGWEYVSGLLFFDGLLPGSDASDALLSNVEADLVKPSVLFANGYLKIATHDDQGDWFDNCCNDAILSVDLANESVLNYIEYIGTNGRSELVAINGQTHLFNTYKYCHEFTLFMCHDWYNGFQHRAVIDGDSLEFVDAYNLDLAQNSGYLPTDLHKESTSEGTMLACGGTKQLILVNDSTQTIEPYLSLTSFLAGMTDPTIIPLSAGDVNLIFAYSGLQTNRMIIFNRDWDFVDEGTLHFEGIPLDISEFMYLSEEDKVVFAYSSLVGGEYASPRVYLQSFSVDFVVEVEDEPALVPAEFTLAQNYPNPFDPTTEILFSIPRPSEVTLDVFNIQGQLVTTLARGVHSAGEHKVVWDAQKHASGVYLYRLTTPDGTRSRKMVLLK